MTKVLILLVIVSIVVGVFSLVKYNIFSAVPCMLSGGQYVKNWELTPFPLERYCLYKYEDAGKKCTSSLDCEGDCLVTEETKLINVNLVWKEYAGGYGECAENNLRSGCSKATIEQPNVICT